MKNAILDTLVITKRQLLQLARVPELLVFSTIQPVMFVLLFRYVFGGSIDTGQPGGYVQLLMPGIFVQTVAFTLASTAIGLAEDMKKGLIDRFRSLPISRGAVIIGRTFGDALLNILVLAVMAAAGYAFLMWDRGGPKPKWDGQVSDASKIRTGCAAAPHEIAGRIRGSDRSGQIQRHHKDHHQRRRAGHILHQRRTGSVEGGSDLVNHGEYSVSFASLLTFCSHLFGAL
mgnify:CR=1 FL=1